MAVDDTSLMNEINTILNSGPKPVNYIWTATISTPAGKLTPFKVMTIDIVRDYIGAMADYINLEVAMGYGTYHQRLMPYANALTCVLSRTPVDENTTDTALTSDIEAQTLRCTPRDMSSATVQGSNTFSSDQTAGDLTSIQKFSFQLQDLGLEQTRLQTVGTVLTDMTADAAIRYIVTKISQQIKPNLDTTNQIRGVDMVTADNSQVYQHILIPHGTPGCDVPFYIAHHFGAPYAAGFGAFLQKNIWYLYPVHDLTLFDKAARSITIINVPKNRMPTMNRTFRRTYNQLIVLATGDVKHQDKSDHQQQTHGNGARFVSADKLLNSFVTVKDNKATALRSTNATELLGQARPSGLNHIPTTKMPVTANPFKELGKISSRMGSVLTVVWENSDPGSVFPGMPCQYLYEVAGQVFALKGQVIGSQTQIAPLQPGLTPGAHRQTTALTLFVEHILDWSSSNVYSGS